MEIAFKCMECDIIYECEGIKKSYSDPVFGPCEKTISYCPKCKSETGIYIKPKQKRKDKICNHSCQANYCCQDRCHMK